MKRFDEIKGQCHDASGLDNPNEWMWQQASANVTIWYPVQKIEKNGEKFSEESFIESIDDGWNSGGHIFLDTITMKDGTVLVISDDVICLYKNQDSFDEGKQCICSMGRPDEDINDMFKTPELIPKEVMKILDKYVPDHDSVSYEVLAKCLKKLEKIGWRFDYGLDAVPFNLRKK